jgi:hypothetical protein
MTPLDDTRRGRDPIADAGPTGVCPKCAEMSVRVIPLPRPAPKLVVPS